MSLHIYVEMQVHAVLTESLSMLCALVRRIRQSGVVRGEYDDTAPTLSVQARLLIHDGDRGTGKNGDESVFDAGKAAGVGSILFLTFGMSYPVSSYDP